MKPLHAIGPRSAALIARRLARANACRDPELRALLGGTPAEVPPRGATGGARLLARQAITDDLLRLEVSRPAGFDYAPGQHVKLGVPGITRKYSIVSAPHEAHLEFFVRLIPGGRLSERLRALAPGSALTLGPAGRGKLRLDARPNHLLLATVTGIAPYVSLLRHAFANRASARRFIVLHGARYADELGYRAELEALAARYPRQLVYQPTVTEPNHARSRGWRGATGRVGGHAETALARYGLTPADTAVFACGNPDMVRQLGAAFRARGFATATEAFT